MKITDKPPKHTTPEASRKLVQSVVDSLLPWDLKIYKASGRLPKAQREGIEQHRWRMKVRRAKQSYWFVTDPHVFPGTNWKTHVPYKKGNSS